LIDVAKNIPRIIDGVKRHRSSMLKGFIGDPLSKLIIFGPTPELIVLPNFPEIKVGSVRLTKGKARDIVFSFDTPSGTGGRFMGFGHKNLKAKKGEQWWRMDWHAIGPPTLHPMPSIQQEASNEYWASGNFHHHTR